VRGSNDTICIINKPDVREEVQKELVAALGRRSLASKVLNPGSPVSSCPVTLTYDAKFSWDFVTYMAWAEVIVYQQGVRSGDALYSAPRGGWALTTRIYESTESKVETMVKQLFPET
jgi:hypothetical protein